MMIFDTVDCEFLKLAGICRYMPVGLQRRYDTPMFKRRIISNLQEHELIKMQSDKQSYKLTTRGRECLAGMGYEFPKDARMDLKKPSYKRKLKNAQWNVLLTLAGIDIYYNSAQALAETDKGYMSSLLLRGDNSLKVLAGTRFLGLLKLNDTVFVPYYIDSIEDWIIPGYEREIYSSQIQSMKEVKDIQLILTGESLEELWNFTHSPKQIAKLPNGRKAFQQALKELGNEYSLIPFGRDGVIQLKVTTIYRYRERISKAIGCDIKEIENLSECDGMIDNIPYVIAIDFNIKRIVKALKQIERFNPHIVPRICCLPFQRSTMFKLLKAYNAQKTAVVTIDKNNIYNIFPEVKEDVLKREPYKTKEGEYIEVVERKIAIDKIKDFED